MARNRSLVAIMSTALALAATMPAITAMAAEDAACSAEAAIASDAIAAGSYCTDALGPTIELETSNDWTVPLQAPGTLILSDPEAAPPVRALLLMRGRLADDTSDPEAWFAAQEGVEIVSSSPTELGDLDATVFDVTADVPGEVQFLRVGPPVEVIVLRAGESYRIWWAQPDGSDAIVGFAPVAAGDEAWLERADEVMASLAISGDLAGPVLPEASVGPYTAADFALGPLSFVLPEPSDVLEVHPGFVQAQLAGRPAGVVFMAPKETGDGVALPDAAALRAALEAGSPLTEGPTATILGQEVVGTEADEPLSLPALVMDPDAEQPFVATPVEGFSIDYAVDTAAGPLLLAVFAADPADAEDAVAYFEAMVDSITIE
jgi:hypothetical protein